MRVDVIVIVSCSLWFGGDELVVCWRGQIDTRIQLVYTAPHCTRYESNDPSLRIGAAPPCRVSVCGVELY